MVQVLLDRGATANLEDNLGQTPLHMVSLGTYISLEDGAHITQLLLENGADINAQDNNHTTPLDLAKHYRRTEVESLLLHYGDKTNTSLLFYGCMFV
jgi:ankyrin repeat protein